METKLICIVRRLEQIDRERRAAAPRPPKSPLLFCKEERRFDMLPRIDHGFSFFGVAEHMITPSRRTEVE